MIEPRILKGFRDYPPQMMIPRREMIHTLEDLFTSFGFVPIDTPALEYAEILLGKGSDESDKQLYRFEDNGGRDIALRFDLTVPLARFAAQHVDELGVPFKRYHIAPVWRAEKPQRGRYREFVQCDFDIIGTTSIYSDAEILGIIHCGLTRLSIPHRVRVNNRRILNGLLEGLGARDKSTLVLRAVDKLEKLGADVVRSELCESAGLSAQAIEDVFAFLTLSSTAQGNREILAELRKFFARNESALRGVNELERVIELSSAFGATADEVQVDLSIARGLDYYTGTVFEAVCTELPGFGSITGGGRYDNLASLYTKRELPGVGASIGLDRIIGLLEELGRISPRAATARVLVTLMDEASASYCFNVAAQLRALGCAVEIYPDPGKLGPQFKYADRKGIEFVVIAGEREIEAQACSVKNMRSGEQLDNVPLGELAARVPALLG